MSKVCITVLTPTYNRRKSIETVFASLCAQTSQNFQWLVIDDGSTDETEIFFNSLPDHKFEVSYYKKANGGKCDALNYSHPYIEGKLVVIVDSDDYLLPNAVETIETDWEKYDSNNRICGLCYQKMYPTGNFVSSYHEPECIISDHIVYRVNKRYKGDRCEVTRTELFTALPFPLYPNEKFMGESWLWNHLAYTYATVYINKAIYICEYLDDGLTRAGRSLRIKNPHNLMENCKSFFVKKVNVMIKIKEMWLYWAYGKFAGLSFVELIRSSGMGIWMLINAPFGLLLYLHWKKYNRG